MKDDLQPIREIFAGELSARGYGGHAQRVRENRCELGDAVVVAINRAIDRLPEIFGKREPDWLDTVLDWLRSLPDDDGWNNLLEINPSGSVWVGRRIGECRSRYFFYTISKLLKHIESQRPYNTLRSELDRLPEDYPELRRLAEQKLEEVK